MVNFPVIKGNFILLLCMMLICNFSFAANISVSTDRSPVGLNESFVLTFESDSSVDDEPDFSPLNKDFQVLSRNSNSSMSIVNGKISTTKKWQLTVLARRAGKLIVPAISFGKDKSQPSFINVSKSRSTANTKQNSEDVFIEVEVTPTNVYVQAQLIYTVRLFLSVPTSNASLSEPGISGANAVIERLGEDTNYQTSRRGKRYNVVERRYAIYPQVSGELTIEPVMFQGQLSRNAFSLFDPFGPQAKTIVERSESFTLEVKPIPADFPGGHWIPAQLLTLNESWSPNPPQFKVGEPLTRTLTLSAAGQTASQLPELPAWIPDDFKQYPDQPILNDSPADRGITATRQEKVAIIPNRSGEYVLPEIAIPWWNTTTDKLEIARLPERIISVEGLSATPEIQQPSLPAPELVPDDIEKETEDLDPQSGDHVVSKTESFWQWISAALAFAWMLTLLLWWRSRQRGEDTNTESEGVIKTKEAIKAIQLACHENDPVQAKTALLRWASLNWRESPAMSLGEIMRRVPAELADRLNELNELLYSKNRSDWNGENFWQAFRKNHAVQTGAEQADSGKLEPLYRI